MHAVLWDTHPDLRDLKVGVEGGAFEPFPNMLATIPALAMAELVEKVGAELSGVTGLSRVDAVDLKNWYFRFSTKSEALREEMAEWADWLQNSNPPWAAIHAILACRLLGLDKVPGTRPVGIGEVFCRLWTKITLELVGDRAMAACGNLNLCVGFPVGIEEAVPAV